MKLFSALTILFLVGCSNADPEALVPYLNGYWEIDHVELKDGSRKDFKVNANVDYITLTTDSSGVRKKLAPKLDGSFAQTKSAEMFTIRITKDSLLLEYKTPYATWNEWVSKASQEALIIQNSDGLVYHYKKFESTDVLKND